MSTEQEVAARKPASHVRNRLRWWTKWGAALILGLAVVEILLRIVFGLGSPLLYQADASCGYLPKPNQNLRRFFAHNEINQFGMRSANVEMPRPAGHLRVFFIGDSITYGTTMVDQKQIFTSLLAASLPTVEHKPIDVLNASAGEWAIGNEVGYLRSRGTFDADVVLLVLNSGDPGQSMAFLHEDTNFPTQQPLTALSEVWSRYAAPRWFPQSVSRDPSTTAPIVVDAQQALVENRKTLEQAAAFCEQKGVAFGIVHVPFVGWNKDVVARAQQELADWTADHHVLFIDTSAAVLGEKPDAISYDGIHLRALGNEVVAREITRQWAAVDEAVSALKPSPAATSK